MNPAWEILMETPGNEQSKKKNYWFKERSSTTTRENYLNIYYQVSNQITTKAQTLVAWIYKIYWDWMILFHDTTTRAHQASDKSHTLKFGTSSTMETCLEKTSFLIFESRIRTAWKGYQVRYSKSSLFQNWALNQKELILESTFLKALGFATPWIWTSSLGGLRTPTFSILSE